MGLYGAVDSLEYVNCVLSMLAIFQVGMENRQTCRMILLSLNQLRLRGELCDVMLVVDSVHLSAHRLVLAATSPFFKQLILGPRASSHQMFKLDGISKTDMLHVLDFLYTGQLSLTATNVQTLTGIGKQLNIPVLLDHCRLWYVGKPQTQPSVSYRVTVAKLKKGNSRPIPSTFTRQSEELLETYRSQTKSFHNYCVQKDLLDISNQKLVPTQSSTVNAQGAQVSPVDDLSVCCQLQTQSDELNSGQGTYGMYSGCTDTCCGEILPPENIKKEIKQEKDTCDYAVLTPSEIVTSQSIDNPTHKHGYQDSQRDSQCSFPNPSKCEDRLDSSIHKTSEIVTSWSVDTLTPKNRYQDNQYDNVPKLPDPCKCESESSQSVDISLQTAQLEHVENISKADVQLHHALTQITRQELCANNFEEGYGYACPPECCETSCGDIDKFINDPYQDQGEKPKRKIRTKPQNEKSERNVEDNVGGKKTKLDKDRIDLSDFAARFVDNVRTTVNLRNKVKVSDTEVANRVDNGTNTATHIPVDIKTSYLETADETTLDVNTDVRTSEKQSVEVRSAGVRSANVSSTNVRPTDVSSSDASTTHIMSTESNVECTDQSAATKHTEPADHRTAEIKLKTASDGLTIDNNQSENIQRHTTKRNKKQKQNTPLPSKGYVKHKKKSKLGWTLPGAKQSDDVTNLHCLYCPCTGYNSYASLLEHVKEEHNFRAFQCPKCHQLAPSQSRIDIHLQKCEGDLAAAVFPIPEPEESLPENTEKETGYVYRVKRRTGLETKAQPKLYARLYCPVCPFTMTATKGYQEHLVNEHGITDPDFIGKNTYVGCCEYCPYKTVMSTALTHHRQEHKRNGTNVNPERKKALRCTYCEYSSATYKDMKIHQYKVHNKLIDTATEVHYCSKCSYSTVCPNLLQLHKARAHGDRKFRCGVCSLRFTTKLGLKAHLHVHSPRRFKCNLCGYVAKRKNHLTNHLQSKHLATKNTDRLFICECCGHSTKTKTTLAKHLQEGCTQKPLRRRSSEISEENVRTFKAKNSNESLQRKGGTTKQVDEKATVIEIRKNKSMDSTSVEVASEHLEGKVSGEVDVDVISGIEEAMMIPEAESISLNDLPQLADLLDAAESTSDI